jgi:hypothetical protein
MGFQRRERFGTSYPLHSDAIGKTAFVEMGSTPGFTFGEDCFTMR